MRRLIFFLAIATLAFPLALCAQSTPSTAPAQTTDPKQDKKDKDKPKDKKNKGNDTVDTEAVFNERVANDVLGQIRDGLEGHSQRTMLGA